MTYIFGKSNVTFSFNFCKQPDDGTKETKHVAYFISVIN